jgi:hypothetical protein
MRRSQKMSRVLPILFNAEMVRAILDGRKSCTRRLVKHDVESVLNSPYHKAHPEVEDKQIISKLCNPPYQPGDILYVRETWCGLPVNEAGHFRGYPIYYYRADGDLRPEGWRGAWHPSIHMPKEAARIWLKATDVRVERLQEMKPVDVIKEGAYPDCWDCLNTYGESGSQCCYGTEEQCSQCDEVMMEWEKLWNSTIKKSDLDCYGWNANPWVWEIEFERCEKPEGV